jgi:GTP pyrophosphokinase
MLTEAAKRQGIQLSDVTKTEYFSDILKRFNMDDTDDVYAAIGYGGITTGQVLQKLVEQHKKEERRAALLERLEHREEQKNERAGHTRGIIVKGEPNMVVRFAHCCSPLPGDNIIGYVTRGRGVSIHRSDCPNVAELLADEGRIIDVEWAQDTKSSYTASIQIIANERSGLLMDISQLLVNLNISIKAMTAKTDKNNIVTTQLSFDVTSTDQLAVIIKNMRKIKSVTEVYRLNV